MLKACKPEEVAWPSGLRRWIKAPVSSGAWVRIPPLPGLFSLLRDCLIDEFSSCPKWAVLISYKVSPYLPPVLTSVYPRAIGNYLRTILNGKHALKQSLCLHVVVQSIYLSGQYIFGIILGPEDATINIINKKCFYAYNPYYKQMNGCQIPGNALQFNIVPVSASEGIIYPQNSHYPFSSLSQLTYFVSFSNLEILIVWGWRKVSKSSFLGALFEKSFLDPRAYKHFPKFTAI